MNARKFHEVWIEQCDAAHEIKLRYGVKAAFDYLVADKLFNFVVIKESLATAELGTS